MLSYLLGKVWRYRLPVCIQNIARAFPEYSYQEIAACTGAFYQHLARIGWEVLFPSLMRLEVRTAARFKMQRWRVNRRPVILLLGHYGNWEVLSKLPLFTDVPVKALYKPLKNRLVDRLVRSRRSRYGLQLLPSGRALRVLLKEGEEHALILFIADQFPGHGSGVEVDFLHQRTRMFSGAEQLARRLSASVGYVELCGKEGHTWEMDIRMICEDASVMEEGDITRRYAEMLEESIRREPAWWLWSHRRWK